MFHTSAPIYLFSIANTNGQFAFCYKSSVQFTYDADTLLPIGINPSENREGALIYLMQRYIENRNTAVHSAIIYLKPSMKDWSHQHFVNFLGEDYLEYSSDSDDDERDKDSFSKADQMLSQEILGRKKDITATATLEKRIKTIIKKTKSETLATSTIKTFSEERQPYFRPTPALNEAELPIRFGSHEFKSELELINVAVRTSTLSIRAVKKDNKTSIEISGTYENEAIHYVLGKQYYFPLFRGISYLVDRWTKQGRKASRRAPPDFDTIHYAEANMKQIPGFYNHPDYSTIDFKRLHEEARILKTKLIGLKKERATLLETSEGARQFDNFLDYLQHSFSNGIVNFIKHIGEFNKVCPGVLPNDGTPFVPLSHLPFHAVRYAFGEKNPYKNFALPTLWDTKGRARKPHVGKLVLCIHPFSDFLNLDEPNVVPYLTKMGISVPKVIGAEYEVSFLSFIPKERIFKTYVIRYPSFHKEYNPKYLAKYGLSPELFKGFKECILNPSLRENAAEVLKTWLCMFHSIKIMEEITREITTEKITREIVTKAKGTMLFFHPDGSFQTHYPSEDYESDTQALAQSKASGSANAHKAIPLLTDNISYAGTRRVSLIPDSLDSSPRTPLSGAKIKRTESFSRSGSGVDIGGSGSSSRSSLGSGKKSSQVYGIISPDTSVEKAEDMFSDFSKMFLSGENQMNATGLTTSLFDYDSYSEDESLFATDDVDSTPSSPIQGFASKKTSPQPFHRSQADQLVSLETQLVNQEAQPLQGQNVASLPFLPSASLVSSSLIPVPSLQDLANLPGSSSDVVEGKPKFPDIK